MHTPYLIPVFIRDQEADAWKLRGACRDEENPDEVFFPVQRNEKAHRAGKKICSGCPVRVECGEWAFEHGEETGIWGGMSEYDRRRLGRYHKDTPAGHRHSRSGNIPGR